MLQRLKHFNWREALPRMGVDFGIVHLSMIAALGISIVYQTAIGHASVAYAIVSGSRMYYTAFFWLLSPLFPLVFLLNGFYTRSRAYIGRQKALTICRGVLLSSVIFFAVNFLLFANEKVGRSVAVPFIIIAALGASSVRMLKDSIERHYFSRSKGVSIVGARRPGVLVVGGAGYIGSILVDRLLERKYQVRVLDSMMYGDEALSRVKGHPNCELIVGDARNIQDVVRSVQGVESIVDLAAIVGDPACNQDGGQALETNYAATRMLIEIARGHGIGRFVFASSCSVYGATDLEVDEKAAVLPISLYAQTKVDSEKALLETRSNTFHPIILRFATVFGLGYRPRFDLVVNLLTAKAHKEGVITIYNGQQWRPFIHVRDLAEATIKVLEAPLQLVSGEVFNVGDARLNHTLGDVAEIIRDVVPNLRVEYVDNSDKRNYRVNFEKIVRRTGFHGLYSLQDGVKEIIEALKEGLIENYADFRYHNQLYLKAIGNQGYRAKEDAMVMAAFANHEVPDDSQGVPSTIPPQSEQVFVRSGPAKGKAAAAGR